MSKKQSLIATGLLLVLFVICAVTLIYLLRDLDMSIVQRIGPSYLLAIVFLSALIIAFYTIAIYLLVRVAGYRINLGQAYLVLTASLSANYVTPIKVGIPLRIYLYNHFVGIPAGMGTALAAIETLIGAFVSALAASLGIAFLFTNTSIYLPVALLAILLVIAITVTYMPTSLISLFAKRLPCRHFIQHSVRFLTQVQIGLQSVPAWVLLTLATLFTLNFVIHAVRLHLVLQILGHPISLTVLFFALTISVTAGNVSMIPMGLGVSDVSLALLLAQIDVPNEVMISATVIQRLLATGLPLLLGLISANVLGLSELAKQSKLPSLSQEEEMTDG